MTSSLLCTIYLKREGENIATLQSSCHSDFPSRYSHRFLSLPALILEFNTRCESVTSIFSSISHEFSDLFLMGDGCNLEATSGGYSDSDQYCKGGVRPKGLRHVTFFIRQFPLLVFYHFTLRKQKRCPLYSS